MLSELLKSTLPPGATLPPVASPLAATFQPALAVSLTILSCSSVAPRPTVAKLGSVNVLLLKPWMSLVTPLRLTVPLVTPPAATAVVVVPLLTVRPVVLSTL
ncbi:hypothetical protein D9M72_562010 [compost metagenome]